MLEEELYEPMRVWLEQYLTDKYKGHEIIVVDTHSERLDRALAKYDIVNEMANGVDIQIDVLGIARKQGKAKLFFIEAKKTMYTIIKSLYKKENLLINKNYLENKNICIYYKCSLIRALSFIDRNKFNCFYVLITLYISETQ